MLLAVPRSKILSIYAVGGFPPYCNRRGRSFHWQLTCTPTTNALENAASVSFTRRKSHGMKSPQVCPIWCYDYRTSRGGTKHPGGWRMHGRVSSIRYRNRIIGMTHGLNTNCRIAIEVKKKVCPRNRGKVSFAYCVEGTFDIDRG